MSARLRQWLARKLDPEMYEAAHRLHACLHYVTESQYEHRYEQDRPKPCCYQSVLDYGDACVTSPTLKRAEAVHRRWRHT